MNTPLDQILRREDASAELTTEEQVTQTATEAEGQQTEGQTEQTTEGQSEGEGERNGVPVAALQAERAKVKRYTEQVASFEQTLKERDAAWERRLAQLTEAIKPKQEPQAAPDWFENPTEAMRHQLTQQVSPAFEQFGQQLQAIAKDNAIVRFTEEKVTEAEQAFISAMQSNKLDPADYQRVVSSPNRYAAAVQWHQRQQAQAEIGDDPAAYKAKLEAEIREKVLAEINSGTDQPAQQRQQVMPSNFAAVRNVGSRTGPAWSGPQPIDSIFATRRQPG